MDAGNGRATIAQMGDSAHHSFDPFLCGSDGIARFECTRRGNDFDPARRFLFRTKSLCSQQPRRRGFFSSLLEYERTLFHRFSTLLLGGGRNHSVCRSAVSGFATLGAPDPFLPRSLLRGPRHLVQTGFEWLCRGGSVSFAAWLGSLPFVLWYFHIVTPISLLANLVVVPIAFFILAIAQLSLLLTPLLLWAA